VDFSGHLAIAVFFLIQITLRSHLRPKAVIRLVVEDKAQVGQARSFPVEMFNARR
jgi:hypothetical protein